MKLCSGCKQTKSLEGWHKDKKTKDGYSTYCPACKAEKRKQQYWKKVELNREKSLTWYINNRERGKDTRRAYSRKNSVQAVERSKLWVANNINRRREIAKLYQSRRRAAFKVPYTQEAMLQRFSVWGFKCWLCKTAEFEVIEHVKPLSKGGWDCLANIRPACTSCNSKKAAVWPYVVVLELFGGTGS